MQSLAACQRPGGAFLRAGTGRVLSCVPTPVVVDSKPAKKAAKGAVGSPPVATFDVSLSDTVLFPEGGGQPTDTGIITCADEQFTVVQVLRTPGGIVHRVDKPLPVDAEVTMAVDWTRRFDHMQCHSSQHLISAVARKLFNLKTLSWWLASAPQECHIEFDAAIVSAEQLAAIEAECNDYIRRGAPLKLHAYESLDAARADPVFAAGVTKEIPESHEGAIRVIEIEGLEFNPCCGTHLTSAAEMQAIKLTRCEKGKTSSKVFFLTGGRTLAALSSALEVQRGLTSLLSCAPDVFVEKVKALQTDARATSKTLERTLEQLAEADALKLCASIAAGTRAVHLHRDDVQLDYLTLVGEAVARGVAATAGASAVPSYLLFASTTDAVGGASGQFLLVGDEAQVTALGSGLATRLTGKGGGRKGRFQAKATAMDEQARSSAVAWLQEQLAAVAQA